MQTRLQAMFQKPNSDNRKSHFLGAALASMGRAISLVLLVLNAALLWSQPINPKLPEGTLLELNRIQFGDSQRLAQWNQHRLNAQQQGFPLQILHIGDSHLQGGALAAAVRKQLQQVMGNGGIGLTFPYAAARTYTPMGYKTAYTGKFEFAKSFSLPPKLPLGLMGATAKTKDPSATIHFVRLPTQPANAQYVVEVWADGTDSMFSLQVFNGKQWIDMRPMGRSPYMAPEIRELESPADEIDSISDRVALLSHSWEIPPLQFEDWRVYTATVNAQDSVSIRFQKTQKNQTQIEIYGANIFLPASPISHEADSGLVPAGLVYHNAGMGGARFESLLYESLLPQQLQYLNPSVVILDLGTNDVAPLALFPDKLKEQIELCVDILQQSLPHSLVVLSSPMDMEFKGRKVVHTYPLAIMLKEIAMEKECLLWDYYWLSGAKGSLNRWQEAKLVSTDGIHMTELGYTVKGNLLSTALLELFASVNTGNLERNRWLNEDSIWLVWNGILPTTNSIKKSAKSKFAQSSNTAKSQTVASAPPAKPNLPSTTKSIPTIPAKPLGSPNRTVFGEPRTNVGKPNEPTNPVRSSTNPKMVEKKVRHTVKPGEDIFDIAFEFGVTVAQIKKWNGLTTNSLRPGKVIFIVKSAPIGTRR